MSGTRPREIGRPIVLAFVVLALLAGLVCVALFVYSLRDSTRPGQDRPCGNNPVKNVQVKVEAWVDIENLDYPRVTSKLTVRVPVAWLGASALLGSPNEAVHRDVMRCLLQIGPSDEPRVHELRDHPPLVTVDGKDAVLVDMVRTDIVKPGALSVGLMRFDITQDKWTVRIPVDAYRLADRTEVSITVPPGWLGSVSPWPPTSADRSQVMWVSAATDQPGHAVQERYVELHPDPRTEVLSWGGTSAGAAIGWLLYWLGALAAVLIARRRLRGVDDAAISLRVVRPLLLVVLLPAVLTTTGDAGWDYLAQRFWQGNWGWIFWAVDLTTILVVLLLSWRWWLPRTVMLPCLVACGGAAGTVLWFSGDFPFEWADRADGVVIALAEVGISYVCALLMLAAVGNAALVLRSGSPHRRLPWWLWASSAAGAAILVGEHFWITSIEIGRRDWLSIDTTYASHFMNAFRWYLWDLVEDLSWVLLVLTPLAVWAAARSSQPQGPDEAKRLGVGLFLLGPVGWYLFVWGFELPVWPLGLAVLLACMRFKAPPKKAGTELEASWVKEWWLGYNLPVRAEQATDSSTEVESALADGPEKTPAGNMKKAMWLSVPIAVLLGLPSLWLWWNSRPLFVPGQTSSILLTCLEGLVWEAAKWLFGAASVGLLWSSLPGRRGPVKVLPVIFAFFVVDAALFTVPLFAGGASNPLRLVDVGLFACGMIILGLLMDRAALAHLPKAAGRWRSFVERYGLENVGSQLTLLLALVTAVLSIWGFFQGGEPPSAPNVDTVQSPRSSGFVR